MEKLQKVDGPYMREYRAHIVEENRAKINEIIDWINSAELLLEPLLEPTQRLNDTKTLTK